MSLRTIVATLGGELYDGGRRASVPAPGHSRSDRSVSLVLSGGKVIAHSFGGAAWQDVLDDLRRRGLIDSRNAPSSLSHPGAIRSATETPAPARRIATAEDLWKGARAIGRSCAARHLRRRGVTRALPDAEVLRWRPDTPTAVYSGRGRRMDALLAAIRSPDGKLTGVEVTYLLPDGRRNEALRLPRKSVGVIAPGSAIRLDASAREMLVAEGVATALSASEIFQLPAWALMSTSNMSKWRPPSGVRRVLIAADRGEGGEGAARALRQSLMAHGVGAPIALPPPGAEDWNTALAKGKARAGEGAPWRVGEACLAALEPHHEQHA